MNQLRIDIPKDGVADFCRRHHIRRLALFGSVLREDFRADSDMDVLVEFEPRHMPGFIRLANMELGLERLFGGHDRNASMSRGIAAHSCLPAAADVHDSAKVLVHLISRPLQQKTAIVAKALLTCILIPIS